MHGNMLGGEREKEQKIRREIKRNKKKFQKIKKTNLTVVNRKEKELGTQL